MPSYWNSKLQFLSSLFDEWIFCRADLVSHHHRHHPSMPMKTGKKGRRPCPHCGKLVINLALHVRTKHETDPLVSFSSGIAQCRQCGETYAVNTDHASLCRWGIGKQSCQWSLLPCNSSNDHLHITRGVDPVGYRYSTSCTYYFGGSSFFSTEEQDPTLPNSSESSLYSV